jgi:3-hydroxyisobutyrate dehydrogenase
MDRLGFIGTGTMGLPMCLNLCKAGFPLSVYDRRPEAARAVLDAGARWAASSRAVAQVADIVITMLPNTPDVEQALLGPDGVLAGAHPGLVVADMSTIAPAASRRLASTCRQQEVTFVDAPVSGGVQGARDGTLTIMAGGEAAVMDHLRPVFAVLGAPDRLVHAGDVGAGEIVKLINQHLVGVIAAATLEALVLGVKAGVPMETLYQVVSTSSGSSWQLTEALSRRPLRGDFAPGFTTDLLVKDLRLVQELAEEHHVPVALVALTRQLYEAVRARGEGSSDYSAVVRILEELTGVQARFSTASPS